MPKLNCLCDEPINLSPLPNPQGFKLLPESSLEPLIDALTAAHAERRRAMTLAVGPGPHSREIALDVSSL